MGWSADVAHIKLIAEHLDAVERGEIDRLAIHMPPRHAKSETVTYRYPVYCLERDPSQNVLVTGYNERFARKFGRRNRNLAIDRGLIGNDKTASDEWETTAGGLLMTRGVGSPPTGTGFKRIIIDDPVRRRQDAESETLRDSMWDWYTDDLYSRLEPGGAIVLIMTLWHEDDLGARAVASEPGRWTVLKLPALAEPCDILGREEGQALWPDRFTREDLIRIRDVMAKNDGERSFEALYQQNPTPREGDFFKVGKVNYIDAADLPTMLRRCRAWDLAATKGGGDWSRGVLEGVDEQGRFYMIDLVGGQLSSDDRNALMRETAQKDGKDIHIRLPQDPGQAGKDQAQSMIRMFAGYSVSAQVVSGSKETRADAWSSQVNAGNFYMVRAPWNKSVIEEMRTFPNGKTDDIIDAGADSFTVVSNGGTVRFRFY